MKSRCIIVLSALCFWCGAFTTSAQTNLLVNSSADSGIEGWRPYGKAAVEEVGANKVFVVRSDDNGQIYSFIQIVDLAKSDIGKYALFIGRGSSERVNADGAITGLPSLYGYMLRSYNATGARINDYLQGQTMLARPARPDDWVTMWGIFRVPENTVAIQFMLNQASRRGVPPNGSAARFDDLGLYLFDTEEEAIQFVKTYQ